MDDPWFGLPDFPTDWTTGFEMNDSMDSPNSVLLSMDTPFLLQRDSAVLDVKGGIILHCWSGVFIHRPRSTASTLALWPAGRAAKGATKDIVVSSEIMLGMDSNGAIRQS